MTGNVHANSVHPAERRVDGLGLPHRSYRYSRWFHPLLTGPFKTVSARAAGDPLGPGRSADTAPRIERVPRREAGPVGPGSRATCIRCRGTDPGRPGSWPGLWPGFGAACTSRAGNHRSHVRPDGPRAALRADAVRTRRGAEDPLCRAAERAGRLYRAGRYARPGGSRADRAPALSPRFPTCRHAGGPAGTSLRGAASPVAGTRRPAAHPAGVRQLLRRDGLGRGAGSRCARGGHGDACPRTWRGDRGERLGPLHAESGIPGANAGDRRTCILDASWWS